MEAIATRPAASCCRALATCSPRPAQLPRSALPSGARHNSSAARTRRMLNIPPHPSFITSSTSSAASARPTTSEIVFNPPAAESSVYHTPFKFLPKTDPRRVANLTSELLASSTTLQFPSSTSPTTQSSPQTEDNFPPALGRLPQDKAPHHLTKADIEEMRRLRQADPVTHSVLSLARQFGCSKLFVMMCCESPREHRDKYKAELESTKERWGPRRRAAREERSRRFAMLFNGEL